MGFLEQFRYTIVYENDSDFDYAIIERLCNGTDGYRAPKSTHVLATASSPSQ
jgi:hypothetical protein